MPTEEKLERMRRFIEEQLGFEPGEPSVEDLSSEDLEETFWHLWEDEDLVEDPEASSEEEGEGEAGDGAPGTERETVEDEPPFEEGVGQGPPGTGAGAEPVSSDPITQFRLMWQQGHGMAMEWAERLGEAYGPFIGYAHGVLYYGAEHKTDPSLNQFSGIGLPEELTAQLGGSGTGGYPGPIYKWAWAEYQKLCQKAEEAVEEQPDPSGIGERQIVEEDGRIEAVYRRCNGSKWHTARTIEVPMQIRRILEEGHD